MVYKMIQFLTLTEKIQKNFGTWALDSVSVEFNGNKILQFNKLGVLKICVFSCNSIN